MSTDFELTEPDLFTAGAIGEPGARVFYLQARQSGNVVTLRLEKQQVSALGEYLGGLLENLAPPTEPLPDDLALVQPAVEEWIVGSLAVAYNETDDRFLVVAEELIVVDEDEGGADDALAAEEPDTATARFHLTREQVAAFVPHAAAEVTGGRPLCPVCGRPIDAEGHVCARSNGHHK